MFDCVFVFVKPSEFLIFSPDLVKLLCANSYPVCSRVMGHSYQQESAALNVTVRILAECNGLGHVLHNCSEPVFLQESSGC